MADATALEVPADLAQVAEEKGIPLDLMRRAPGARFSARRDQAALRYRAPRRRRRRRLSPNRSACAPAERSRSRRS